MTSKYKFKHFIPCVNRLDLLEKAVNSTEALAANTILIDNSGTGMVAERFKHLEVYTPDVPLTTAQTYNLIIKLAKERGCDFYTFMHNDGEAHPGVAEALIKLAEGKLDANERWGVIFTHYDVFCAYNMKAVMDIGEFDWLRFPYYFLDNDYFLRMERAGWAKVNTSLQVEHHNGASSTIKADPLRNHVNGLLFPISQRLYNEKWSIM
jgi:GT2 family glycosyltransferase